MDSPSVGEAPTVSIWSIDVPSALKVPDLRYDHIAALNNAYSPILLLGDEFGRLIQQFHLETAPGSQWTIIVALVLPILSGLIGPFVRVNPGPRAPTLAERVIVWAAAVAPTGSGKTPALAPIQRALEIAQRIIQLYCSRRLVPDALLPTFISTAKTIEKLLYDLAAAPDSVQIRILDELTELMTGLNQYKAGGSDMEIIISLKNGSTQRHSTMSGKSAPVIIQYPHFTICGGLQPVTFQQYFNNPKAEATGFAGRLLAFHATSKAKSPELSYQELQAFREQQHSAQDAVPAARVAGIKAVRKVGSLLPDAFQPSASASACTALLADSTTPSAPPRRVGKRSRGDTAASPDQQQRADDEVAQEWSDLDTLFDSLTEKMAEQPSALLPDPSPTLSAREAEAMPDSWWELLHLFISVYMGTRSFSTSSGVTVLRPAAQDFTLAELNDPGEPAYKLFDDIVRRLDAAARCLVSNGKADRAGRLNKMAGDVMQLACLYHIVSTALKNPLLAQLDPDGGPPTAANKVIPVVHVQAAIRTLQFSLSQLVLMIEDMDMYEACTSAGLLLFKLEDAGVGAGATDAAAGASGSSQGGGIPAVTQPQPDPGGALGVWRGLVSSLFREFSGNAAFSALGAAKTASPFKSQSVDQKWVFEASARPNTLLAKAMSAGKVLDRFRKTSPEKEVINLLGGGISAIAGIMKVASGQGSSVARSLTMTISEKYKNDAEALKAALALAVPAGLSRLPAIGSLAIYSDTIPAAAGPSTGTQLTGPGPATEAALKAIAAGKGTGSLKGAAKEAVDGNMYLRKLVPQELLAVDLGSGDTPAVRSLHQDLARLKADLAVYGLTLVAFYKPAHNVMSRIEAILCTNPRGGVTAGAAGGEGPGLPAGVGSGMGCPHQHSLHRLPTMVSRRRLRSSCRQCNQ